MKNLIILVFVTLICLSTCIKAAVINNDKLTISDEELSSKWIEFKQENNIDLNPEEDLIHYEIFKNDYIHVMLHNQEFENKKKTFATSVNQFSVRSYDDYLMKLVNLTEEIPVDMPPPSIQFDSVTEIPNSFDWRTFSLVSKPMDQTRCGGCWAFAVASAVETLYAQKTGKLVELSKQELLDCTPENLGCDGGWPVNGFYHAYVDGLIEDEHYKYTSEVKNCSNQTNNLKRYKVKGYQTIAFGDEEALKRAVATYGPVTIAFDASDWSFAHYSTGVYLSNTCQKNVSNHAALIVGYGTTEDNQDYWIIKNSWGQKWGINGYMHLARNQNNMCGVASVAVYAFL